MRAARWVLPGLILLFLVQGVLQNRIDPTWQKVYNPGETVVAVGPEQILVAMLGFREVLSGILWVRADEFFHTGNYDAILPLVRVCTLLDPHQIDIYTTGAWHMGYNFTDEDQRSDRRYLAPALELLEEGVKNNPGTYEMWFELGWMRYHKIEDYPGAVEGFEHAIGKFNHENIQPARRNILAQAYLKNGQINRALQYYYELYKLNEDIYEQFPDSESARTQRDTVENNLDQHIIRMATRGNFARKRGDFNAAGRYITMPPPLDMGFGARVRVIDPGVLEVVGSLLIMPIGSRVRVTLKNAGYELDLQERPFDVNIDRDVTYMQDSLFNRKGRFARKINMAKDPMMYPFKVKEYDMEFLWSPRWAPAHIQDRLGFDGEGMSDKRFLVTGPARSPGVPSGPKVFFKLRLTRDQILRQGEWRNKVPVVVSAGFVEVPESPEPWQIRQPPPGARAPSPSALPPSQAAPPAAKPVKK